jgi:hypothetical protein
VSNPENPLDSIHGSIEAKANRLQKKATSRGGKSSDATRTSVFMSEKKKAASVIYNAPFVTSEIVGRR